MIKKIIKNINGSGSTIEYLLTFTILIVIFTFYLASISSVFINYESQYSDIYTKNINIAEQLIKEPGENRYNQQKWQNTNNIHEHLSVLGFAKIYPKINNNDIEILDNNIHYYKLESTDPYFSIIKTYFCIFPELTCFPDPIYIIFPNPGVPAENYTFNGNTKTHLVGTLTPNSIMNMFEYDVYEYGVLDQEKIQILNQNLINYEKIKESLGLNPGYEIHIDIIDINRNTMLEIGPTTTEDSNLISSYSRSVVIDDIPAKLTLQVFR